MYGKREKADLDPPQLCLHGLPDNPNAPERAGLNEEISERPGEKRENATPASACIANVDDRAELKEEISERPCRRR
jgi:hypothetical protein